MSVKSSLSMESSISIEFVGFCTTTESLPGTATDETFLIPTTIFEFDAKSFAGGFVVTNGGRFVVANKRSFAFANEGGCSVSDGRAFAVVNGGFVVANGRGFSVVNGRAFAVVHGGFVGASE